MYDTIDSYRLNQAIVEGYLRNKFGNYKFYVEVRVFQCTLLLWIVDGWV